MISGDKERRIAKYFYIDHCGEGFKFVEPGEGETFVGIPYGWYGENADSFIEVRKDGVVIRTVNPRDLSIIEFVNDEEVTGDG